MSSLQGTTPMPLTEDTTEPTTGAVSSSTKQQLEWHTTFGMEGSLSNALDTKERNVSAFYNVVWPILEKEGGWTLVRFCFVFVYVL